jgi:hypothetical protein
MRNPKPFMVFLAGWLLLTATSAHAAAVVLEGLEVVGTPDRLHIMLKSQQLMPARIIRQQADEVIVELTNVNTQTPITTRFSGQNLVSHVSMQAMDDNRLRLVLRGSKLPLPDVGFKPVAATSAHNELFQYETPTPAVKSAPKPLAVPQPKAAPPKITPIAKTAEKPTPQKATQPKPPATDADLTTLPEFAASSAGAAPNKAYASAPKTTVAKTPAKPLFADVPPQSTEATHADPYASITTPAKSVPDVTATTPALPVAAQATAETEAVQDAIAWVHQYGPALLGGMLIALGAGVVVLWHKRRQHSVAQANQLEALAHEAWPEDEAPMPVRRQANRPYSQNPYEGADTGYMPPTEILGLAALRRPNPAGIRQYQQSVATRSVKPPQGSASVANQRLSQMASQTPRPNADLTRDEVRRTANVKQRTSELFQPERVPTTAQNMPLKNTPKAPARNGVRESLEQLQNGNQPANPEVLTFLKSVADYMDKGR